MPWEWTHTQQHAFVTLKVKVTSPPVLAHFDPNAKTTVTTDASGVAVRAVLSQWITGSERPAAFVSRTLSESERKYSTGECKALACIYACEHWHVYLDGRKFTLRTDHHALTIPLTTSGSGHRPLRFYKWSDRLYQYDFGIEYLAGSRNQVADMLSRITPGVNTKNEVISEVDDFVNTVIAKVTANLVTCDELKSKSQQDEIL